MARLKEVAERAQVSLSVASRVLNGDKGSRINADTWQRVLDAAQELQYEPDHRARALRLSRAGAIALVVPEVNNAIFASLHAGVHDACQERSTAVLLGELDAPADEGKGSLARLIGKGRVDGVILQRSEQYSDEELRRAIDIREPVVLFNSRFEGHEGSVSLDDREAVRMALEHLYDLGHRTVGFLSGAAQHDAAARRKDAFLYLVGHIGFMTRDEWIQPAGWEAPAGANAMDRLLDQPDRPTAVLVASINASIGALSAALARGVHVPFEVSLVTIHDTWLARYVTPAMTTVEMPMHSAGHAAATMLLDHLDGAPLIDVVVDDPGPKLIARASTATPR